MAFCAGDLGSLGDGGHFLGSVSTCNCADGRRVNAVWYVEEGGEEAEALVGWWIEVSW